MHLPDLAVGIDIPLVAVAVILGLRRAKRALHKDAPARFAQWLVERCVPVSESELRGTVRLTERKRDIASHWRSRPRPCRA